MVSWYTLIVLYRLRFDASSVKQRTVWKQEGKGTTTSVRLSGAFIFCTSLRVFSNISHPRMMFVSVNENHRVLEDLIVTKNEYYKTIKRDSFGNATFN